LLLGPHLQLAREAPDIAAVFALPGQRLRCRPLQLRSSKIQYAFPPVHPLNAVQTMILKSIQSDQF
jgi:hypothetical protein